MKKTFARVQALVLLALVLMASGAYAATSRVFATSTRHPGDLKTEGSGLPGCGGGACADGLAGGDAICNARASGAGLGGTWVAWLSTSTVDAKDRLTPGSGPFIRAAGPAATIAVSIADLTDGVLDAPILTTELGSPTPGFLEEAVWTGTNENGQLHSPTEHCVDWGSSSGNGLGGRNAETHNQWTRWASAPCNSLTFQFRLYCFEVDPPGPNPVSAASPVSLAVLLLLSLGGLAYLYRRPSVA